MSHFSTHQVAARAGVHKLTLIRWMKQGIIPEPRRDWRGWRTFDDAQALAIEAFAKGNQPIAIDDSAGVGKLAAIDWAFADAKTNYLTHGLHP